MANSLDFRVKNGLVVATTATIQSTTSATSTLTGALTVAGGVGIQGDLYLGGDLYGSLGGGATGSLVYQSATGTTAFLTVGLNGYVLQSNGTNPTWVALTAFAAGSATTASNLANGGPGQVPYQSAAGSTQFIATGTAGTVLVSNGTSAPTFNNTLTLAGTTAATNTTTGALQVRGGVGIGGNLYVGNPSNASTLYALYYNTSTKEVSYSLNTVSLSNITAATANNTINNGNNAQRWNWALNIANTSGFIISESAASTNGTGTQYLVDIRTVAASTANPFRVGARGSTNTFLIDQSGNISIRASQGVSGASSTGSTVTIDGGQSFRNFEDGGGVAITGGFGARGGAVSIAGGDSNGAAFGLGGAVSIAGGIGGNSSYVDGGAVEIAGGDGGTTGGFGGTVLISGGQPGAAAPAIGGAVTISGGLAAGVTISAGDGSPATAVGGAVTISAGTGAGNAMNGGALLLSAGSTTATNSYGGSVTIAAGSGTVSNSSGGSVTIFAGDAGRPNGGGGGSVIIRAGNGCDNPSGNIILTPGTPITGANSLVAGVVRVNSTVTSSGTASGALQVLGGVGIGGALYVGGTSNLQGVTATNIVASGTLGVTGTSILAGLTTVTNVTSATSTNTGALVVRGGVGIGGTLYVGGLRADATTSATTWGVFYNTATKELTTSTAGSPSGSALTATYILTSATIVNSTYYPTFVDSNNASATGESIYTTSSFSVNPATGVLTVKSIAVTTNSNGLNILIGDDAWIGDIDQANTLRVMGNQNNANGYIVFGNSNTLALGRAGTGALTYGGDFTVNGTTAASSTATGALQVKGGAGIGGSLYAGNIYSNGSQVIPLKMEEFTAAGSTTTFIVTGGYTVGTVMVFANGIFLNSGDFTASNGTTIVLNEARSAGDIVKVIAGGTSSAANQSQSFSIAMSVAMSM